MPNKLTTYIKAGFPLINLVSAEEVRAEREVLDACKELKRPLKIWSTTEGFLSADGKQQSNCEDPIEALQQIIKEKARGMVYVFRDLHSFFQGGAGIKVVRLLRDIARDFKQEQRTLIFTSPINRIPVDIDRDVTLVEFDLPTEQTLGIVWDTLYDGSKKAIGEVSDDERERIVQAARGLTTTEAENAYAKAVIDSFEVKEKDKRPAISSLVMVEKALAVKKNGILEYYPAKETLSDIGGLDNLKKWLIVRKGAFSKKAREYGLENPRGILLVGIPGCGKSLGAKATANALGVPLIRFDISKVFAGLVGQSESNMRLALQTIDAIGNCVVWMDELEKGLAGMGGSSNTDSGVSQRCFGMFLTWLQEKKGASFVVATVNRIAGLPPELLRKGRFDEIFYVGLPNEKEREEIFKIQLKKAPRNRDPKKFQLADCVKASKEFSGAEIEEAVVTGMYNAFAAGKEVTDFHIEHALMNTKPLSQTRAQDLAEMAEWASLNAIPASILDEKEAKGFGRKLQVPELEKDEEDEDEK